MYRIAVLPGDGVGPEIVTQGLRVLEAVSRIDGFEYETTNYPHSGNYYKATGVLITPDTIDEIGQHDALFNGAFGDPTLTEGLIERNVSLAINFRLNLAVNVRPGKLYLPTLSPLKDVSDISIAIVRDTSEDCFVAPGGLVHVDTPDEVALGLLVYTRKAVEQTAR
ncbi:MAG TPA: isocitrate/isopropylmalate family dehydrogenase, partial [Gemmatimonadaceae bacterium]